MALSHALPGIGQATFTQSCIHKHIYIHTKQSCKSECLPGQYLKGFCDGDEDYDGLKCIDCTASCSSAGMYMEGTCSGLDSTDTVECVPCPAGAYSLRAGQGVSSCIPCQNGTFSDPGSSLCAMPSSCWPLNVNGKAYRSDFGYIGTSPAGILFQSDTALKRRHTFASLSGKMSDYITVQAGSCAGLPLQGFSASMWVRVDGEHTRSSFIGCFQKNNADYYGWTLGTTVDGRSFAFGLRAASTATLIADLQSLIELGTWYVLEIFSGCICVYIHASFSKEHCIYSLALMGILMPKAHGLFATYGMHRLITTRDACSHFMMYVCMYLCVYMYMYVCIRISVQIY